VILAVAIPGLEDVDFAVARPDEGICGQHPICRPNALCAWRGDGGRQVAPRP
jgi:hypothetical protein